MTTETKLAVESGFMSAFRRILGLLLAVEALVLLPFALLSSVLTPLFGGLAFLAGGADATDRQMAGAGVMVVLMMVMPIIVTALLLLASVCLFLRRHPNLVIISCVVTILAGLGFLGSMAAGKREVDNLQIMTVAVILSVPLAGIVAALIGKGQRF